MGGQLNSKCARAGYAESTELPLLSYDAGGLGIRWTHFSGHGNSFHPSARTVNDPHLHSAHSEFTRWIDR